MSVEDIIQKYNYSEDIANYLRKAYPALVRYFKNETIVHEALMETPIVLTNNLYKCLLEHGFLNNDQDEGVVSYETLSVCAGVYHGEPIIKYNELKKEYSIERVNRIVAINAYSLIPHEYKGTLTHELCHLVKSYYNEYTINGDTVEERSGLISRKYQLIFKDGKVCKKLWSETGVGLEEAFNAVAEEKITSEIIGDPYKTNGYIVLRQIAKNILAYNIPNLHDIIIEAEMYHDNTRLESVLGPVFYEIMAFVDEIYPMVVKMSDINLGKDKRNEIAKEVEAIAEIKYKPLREKLKAIGQGTIVM